MFSDDRKKDVQLAEDISTISRQLESLSTEMKSYLSHTDELQKTKKCSKVYLYYILQYDNRRLETDLQRATVEKGI